MAVYDRTAPVRYSHLRLLAKSPAHFRAGYGEQTSAMELGSAVDALLLNGQAVVAYPGAVRRGKEWEAWKAAHEGSFIVTQSTLDTAEAMKASVMASPEAARLLLGPSVTRQERLTWKWGDRAITGEPDAFVAGQYVVDLKTTQCAAPDKFRWQALRLLYHAQLSCYGAGIAAVKGAPVKDHYIVAVESKAPYPCTVLRVSDNLIEQGRQMVASWLERLKVCEDADQWPGYSQSIVDLDAPEDDAVAGLVFGEDE
jgi:exodeoxyribonuclease VIII